MNSLAVDLVAVARRPIMPSFHAAWSLGGLAGVGARRPGRARAQPPRPLLACLPARPCGHRHLRPDHPRHPLPCRPPRGARRRWQPPGEALPGDEIGLGERKVPNGAACHPRPPPRAGPGCGGRCCCSVIAACAPPTARARSADWGALHLHGTWAPRRAWPPPGYASFALAEAAGRLAGTWLLARLGQTRVLVYGGLVTCAGMLAAALSPVLPLALLGFALAGLGVANAFPTAMSRVGLLGPRPDTAWPPPPPSATPASCSARRHRLPGHRPEPAASRLHPRSPCLSRRPRPVLAPLRRLQRPAVGSTHKGPAVIAAVRHPAALTTSCCYLTTGRMPRHAPDPGGRRACRR